MTAHHDLIASYYTLTGTPVGQPPRFSFDDRVGAAARAGFTGIGMLADDYAALRASGQSDADLLGVLDRHGVRVLEVEFLFDWALEGPRAEAARDAEATLHAMIDARDDFEALHEPEINILCFRWIGDRALDDDALDAINLDLRTRYNRGGHGWMTTTVLGGRRVLRVTVMNPFSVEATPDYLFGLTDAIRLVAMAFLSDPSATGGKLVREQPDLQRKIDVIAPVR